MKMQVDAELQAICGGILAENRSEAEWAEIESDDLIQSERYVGGYDATERAFCFSYFGSDGKEWWFQFSYEDARRISSGQLTRLELRLPG